jgi:hypothetical protein
MTSTIVLLAAGMSTRYGRLKQLEPVGPGGEALLDYAVFDAHRAGFSRVILIIREELEGAFRDHIADRWPSEMEVVFHHQRLDDLPEGEFSKLSASRQKPWGTAHALWSARGLLSDPFAILNADDFYGPSAYAQAFSLLGRDLKQDPGGPAGFGLVAYTLEETLSRHGGVSRGICEVSRLGWLESVKEVLSVKRTGSTVTGETVQGEGLILSGQEVVSTNFWVFTPELFPLLDVGFREFLLAQGASTREDGKTEPEFLIPSEVNRLVAQDEARVWVLRTRDPFFGITRSQDWEWVAGGLRELVDEGQYPEVLWAGSEPQD